MSKAKPSTTLTALLSKADILKAKVAFEYVDVPAWGGRVKVAEMNGTRRSAWEAMNVVDVVEKNGKKVPVPATSEVLAARLVACSVVDEDGNLLFGAEDVPQLVELPGGDLNNVALVAMRLSRLGTVEAEAAEKN